MSDEPETPQQRQARIRREKREAKLKASGQERLDKITRLSGRTPESMRDASPAQTPPISQPSTASRPDATSPSPLSATRDQSNDPEQMRLQEEYMRALLSGTPQGQAGPEQQPGMQEDDPMMKMMQAMLGGLGGDPDATNTGEMPFSAEDVSKMTGIPSFLTNMFMAGKPEAPPSSSEIRKQNTWKIVRTILAMLVGLYTIFIIDKSFETFGPNPPAPATAQNPFMVFLMGELIVNGARITFSGRPVSQSGLKSWIAAAKDVARDAAILIFMVGVYSWWKGDV